MKINKEKTKNNLMSELNDSILVGPPGAHSQKNILMKTSKFLDSFKQDISEKEELKTYQHGLVLPEVSYNEVEKILQQKFGLPKNLQDKEIEAWVTQEVFIDHLIEAVKVAYEIAVEGGTFLFGTGHPNLLKAYASIINMLKECGGHIHYVENHFLPSIDDRLLSNQCGVSILMEENDEDWYDVYSPLHTHDDQYMELILNEEEIEPDIVFADHGYAGTAIRKGIPTITVADTNDIDLLVASSIFPERVFVIPMHDNAGLGPSFSLARCFKLVLNDFCAE